MTQARIIDNSDGRLLPWQQPNETYRSLLQSQFGDVIPENCATLHRTTFPEIDSVAAANISLVCQKTSDKTQEAAVAVSSPDGTDSGAEEPLPVEEQTTQKCPFNHEKSSSEKLRSFAYACRKCYCSYIDEGKRGTMCAWGGVKDKVRTQTSGASVSKRKPYTSVFQRLCAEYKYKPFEFRHTRDLRDYMVQYRRHHTVADVGREIRAPPQFGVDVPDPYAVRIKNICSIVDSCDFTSLLPADTDHSCSDFNSVISTTSGDSGVKDKSQVSDKSKRKKGDKPALTNTRSVASLAPVRQKKSRNQADQDVPHSRPPNDASRTIRNYIEEYEQLRREREALQKSFTLPQIILRAEASSTLSRPTSDSSSATRRLIDELESPFKRLLQNKPGKGGAGEFLTETYHQKSTSVKLSEFLSRALLGDERLRTTSKPAAVAKSAVNVKVKTTPKEDRKEEKVTHLPELVGRTCDRKKEHKKGRAVTDSNTCAKVLSLSLEEIEVPNKSIRNPPNSPSDDNLSMEYKMKKRKIHKVVDLMSIAR